MTDPLVSVITPTWRRPVLLTTRCAPSVAAQTWGKLEHVVVSDGPDPSAREAIYHWWGLEGHTIGPAGSFRTYRYDELDDHDPHPHWGNPARLRGLERARGEFIAYNDDDDAWRPHHLATLMPVLLADPGLGFAYSMMCSRMTGETLIGNPQPGAGHIGTPMIVHRRSILDIATWSGSDAMEDWHLVERWLAAGVRYQFVPEVTIDVWPSQFHQTS